ncbi:uncharacterized protein LOC110857974 [Folsomia candida]|uniref:uncharacterized protein LOC110857974 n=1 Tax=Folsomia candida TaxID=158441 RepID=UPI000B905AC1|nr:uncharacterized protein LOC110857974 [Folsomia candida]
MTWFGLMVVGVTALLGLSACQAAVVHHGRRSEHFVPRNPRETVLSYPEWLSYLAVSSSPKGVDFSQNYASQSAPSILPKDLYPTNYLSQLPEFFHNQQPFNDYHYDSPYLKSPYVTDHSSETAVYKTIADCLHKLQLGAVDQFETFAKTGGYQESELNNGKLATYATPTLSKKVEKLDQIRSGEYKNAVSDKVKSRAGQTMDQMKKNRDEERVKAVLAAAEESKGILVMHNDNQLVGRSGARDAAISDELRNLIEAGFMLPHASPSRIIDPIEFGGRAGKQSIIDSLKAGGYVTQGEADRIKVDKFGDITRDLLGRNAAQGRVSSDIGGRASIALIVDTNDLLQGLDFSTDL